MKAISIKMSLILLILEILLSGCNTSESESSGDEVTPAIALVVSRNAYLYGYPMVENYKTMYLYAIDKDNPDYKGPFNQVHSSANIYTPDDKAVVSPNSDTPYSMAWLDLRTEPIVLTVPKIDKDRYFSVQLVDLYTYNFGYIGTRTTGNDGGSYLIAGPNWKGETPKGIDKVFNAETDFVFGIYRTQLLGPDDIEKVRQIQTDYKAIPLSDFLGQKPPTPAPKINFPPYDAEKAKGIGFFEYMNFLLQFSPVLPSEKKLRDSFEKIGVEPGKPFNPSSYSSEEKDALEDGIKSAKEGMNDVIQSMSNSSEYFGSRDFLGQNYMRRAVAAKVGIYGNSKEEALYHIYKTDERGESLNAADGNYTLTFSENGLPSVDAFWSLTMYDGNNQLLVDNVLNRYLINSSMMKDLKKNPDGGMTIYIQRESPGKEKEANWLPAPDGTFYVVMRMYLPKTDTWDAPPIEKD